MPVLSVDLAYVDYRDVGIAVLETADGGTACRFVPVALRGSPSPDGLAKYLDRLSADSGASHMLIDGPQGWKDPDNGLPHSRRCERTLNTPAKTGLPGTVKPANYGPYVAFSIALYERLTGAGWQLFQNEGAAPRDATRRVLVESFPLSAWRSLSIPGLPAKKNARPSDLEERLTALHDVFPLEVASEPNHDELQALVAGLAGVALERDAVADVAAAGVAPFRLAGSWREGFIVNPRRPTGARAA